MAHHCMHLFLCVPCFTGRGCAKPLSHSAHTVHHGSSLYASVLRVPCYTGRGCARPRSPLLRRRQDHVQCPNLLPTHTNLTRWVRARKEHASIAFLGPDLIPAFAPKPSTLGVNNILEKQPFPPFPAQPGPANRASKLLT
jgi:hypothetical protein